MLISIVVPVYNVEMHLQDCLKSIISQIKDRNDVELILIDDGSLDSSGEICDRYQKMYKNVIKVFHNQNQGLLLTRRFGFNKATGDYIMNCDSDDTLEPNSICELIDIINNDQVDVIIYNANTLLNGEKRSFSKNIFTANRKIYVSKDKVIEEFLSSNNIVSMCMKIFKKSCLNLDIDYKQFSNISNGEDTLQSIEVISNAKSYAYLNKALYNYRLGAGMTNKFDENYYFGFKHICQSIENSDLIIDEIKGELLMIKFFSGVGRSITQYRYKCNLNGHTEYLKKIQLDDYFIENKRYFSRIEKRIQKSHYFFCRCLIKKRYSVIRLALELKNLKERLFKEE